VRDPNRLDKFYAELCAAHKRYFVSQRFGQFMSNFLGWVQSVKRRDIFFPEEDEMLSLLQEYIESQFPYNLSPQFGDSE